MSHVQVDEEIFFREGYSDDIYYSRFGEGQERAAHAEESILSQHGDESSEEGSEADDVQLTMAEMKNMSHAVQSMAGILKEVVTEIRAFNQSTGSQSTHAARNQHGVTPKPYVDVTVPINRPVRARQYGEIGDRRLRNSRNNNSFSQTVGRERQPRSSAGDDSYLHNRRPQNQGFTVEADDDTFIQAPPIHRGQVKIPPFTGKEEWPVWINRFEAIARRYDWSDDIKLDYMLPRLEGQAGQFVFNQLPVKVLDDYKQLRQEMDYRFRVVETSRSYAVMFSRRNQRSGETVEEYAAELKALYDKAHPYRARSVRDEDLVRRFLDGLKDDEARFEVEYHKEPQNIDDAVYCAVSYIQTKKAVGERRTVKRFTRDEHELEDSFDLSRRVISQSSKASNEIGNNRQAPTSGEIDNVLQQILKRLDRIESSQAGKKVHRGVTCFRCHKEGHFARDCTEENGSRGSWDEGKTSRQSEHSRNQEKVNNDRLNARGPSLAAKERSD